MGASHEKENRKMKIGFLFPGQGTQKIGMGQDFYQTYPEAQKAYQEVEKITGIPIAKISFEGPDEVLQQTKYTQLAIVTESLAILAVLKSYGIEANASAGLSLGEYTALIEDGILDVATGIQLVQKRGSIMQEKTPKGNWKMAAVLGLEATKVEAICQEVSQHDFVQVANYNTIGQTVMAGSEQGIQEATVLAKEQGAKKVSVLQTAGPFHTIQLRASAETFQKVCQNIPLHSKQSKVVKNLDGTFYQPDDNLAEILAKHMMSPVQFTKVLQTMYQRGIDTYIEIGPGRTLSGFVKHMKFEGNIQNWNIQKVSDLEQVIKEVKKNA